jgi:hypothetical protein
MKDNKPFTVTITKEGSDRAFPAIWYAGKAGQWFNVIKSKQWPSVYEVINGTHKGKLIDPKDCERITIIVNHSNQK